MNPKHLEAIAKIYSLVAELNGVVLSLKDVGVEVSMGSTGAHMTDPLGEKAQAVVRVVMRTDAKTMYG